ncbi:hypothetical protein [Corynebacterium oculi]|uniref:MFS transporter n=1 Tax=Corynebacterium oculi TaxID=1544416 RepID=A0A0Q0YDQ2_9CORY|nr:hypothetical protein [Corynebacterium oculi]KQB84460.1 hypothetical protein Cocul_01261 [Corynebacterium oculi]
MTQEHTSPRLWWRVALSMFVVAWGGNQFTSMIVFYRGEGEFADLFVDSMLAIYAVGVGVGLLGAGTLADRWGRRAVMLPAPALASRVPRSSLRGSIRGPSWPRAGLWRAWPWASP